MRALTPRSNRGRPRKPLTRAEEIKLIREARARGVTWNDIGLALGIRPNTALSRLQRADYVPKFVRKNWTEEEDRFLLDTWSTKNTREQAMQLGRNVPGVHRRRKLLRDRGLVESADRAYSRPWSREDDKRLATLAHDCNIAQLAVQLNRTPESIVNRLADLDTYSGKNLYRRYFLERLLHVTAETINLWVALGWLKLHHNKGGKWSQSFFHVDDIRAFLHSHPYAYNPQLLVGSMFEVDGAHARRNPWLSVIQAAELVGCSQSTLKIHQAEIDGVVEIPGIGGKQWRFPLASILKFKEQYVAYRNHPIRRPRKAA